MKKNISVLIIAILALTSCESWIDVKPVSEIARSTYWNQEGDVKGYLVGIYTDFRGVLNETFYKEDRGDAMDNGIVGTTSNAWKNSLSVSNAPNWMKFYTHLHHCNLLLKYGSPIPFISASDKNRVLAETYFQRAYILLLLTQSYGDIPIVLIPTESAIQERPVRSPAIDVVNQVLADVDMAISLFPEDAIISRFKASKAAALALKAEALAWKYEVLKSGNIQDVDNALTALETAETISKAQIGAPGTYASVFSDKENTEVIFSIYNGINEAEGMYASRLTTAVTYISSAVNKESIPYSKGGNARHENAPSAKLKSLFATNDNRAAVAYIEAKRANGQVILTAQNKFRGTIYPDADRHFDNNIIVYRLADIVLLRAELLALSNRVPEAIVQLERTRTRAGIGAYTGATTKDEVAKEILNERARELCFELKRWPDLMRAHASGTINIFDVVPNMSGKTEQSCPLYFPIQQAMIDINPNLIQTSGY
ncbi:MAG: RagB/SusD family nutrient uptake outer membrane protein [Paludibacter sp.]|jgi:starch-binding outer membrane protein, SusD/RagB family